MALNDLALLTPDTQDAVAILLRHAKRQFGVEPTVTSTLRSCAEQNGLYAQGRSTPGSVVTNAQGCFSWHVLGRAVDILIPGGKAKDYEALGLFWEGLGGYWGGRIEGLGDLGHFEWHPGYKIEQMCPYPADCDNAVERSRALYLAPPGVWGGGRSNNALMAGIVAATVFGIWYVWTK